MPFDVSINDSQAFPVITLTDASTNTNVEIYAFGALLNQFCVVQHGNTMNVVDGFGGPGDAVKNITKGFKSAKLSPFVCRVNHGKYHFGEGHYALSKFSLGENAIHGLVFDQVFSVIETVATEDEAKLTLQYVYDNSTEGYPFIYRIEVEYRLRPNNTLCLKTTITNIDEQLIPICDGWHPYFTLGDRVNDCQLEFQSKEMLEFTTGLIPTGKLIPYQEFGSITTLGDTFLDNCFTNNMAECQPLAVFRNPAKKIQVEIHPAQSYPYLQIYTPPHRQSIAIENLSAPPDALNNAIGLKVLEPKETVTFSTKYVITTW